MSALTGLQSDFQAFLLDGDKRMLGRVAGTAKVGAETRLAVYYDAYRLRLLEALGANYPVLRAWLGEDEFENIGIAYLTAHPSRHFSIRWFGHRLAEFLAAAQPWSDRPHIVEMAALEWALSEAFDAENGTIMGVDDMAGIPAEAWPAMRLRFHSSAQRLDLRWNVPLLWKAVSRNLDADKDAASCRGETSATPSSGREQHADTPAVADVPALVEQEYPQAWLVWRQELKTWFRSLSVDEAWALDAAMTGENFSAICEGLCEWIDAQNVALHAAGLMKQWISDGLVSGIDLEKE
ncbi:MAG: DNA-binding domain-containing protein [Pseudomonadota bacterium]